MKNHLLLCLLALMGTASQAQPQQSVPDHGASALLVPAKEGAQNPYDNWFPRKYRYTRLSDYCTSYAPNETTTYEYDNQGRKISQTRELEYSTNVSVYRTTWKYDDAGRKIFENVEYCYNYEEPWSWSSSTEWNYADNGLLESTHLSQLYGWHKDEVTRYAYQWDEDRLIGYETWYSWDGEEERQSGYNLYPYAADQVGPEVLEGYNSDGNLNLKIKDIKWDRYDNPLVRLSITPDDPYSLLFGSNRIAGYTCVMPQAGRKVNVNYLDENYSYERTDTDADGKLLVYDYVMVSPDVTSKLSYNYIYYESLGDVASAFELQADELGYQVTTDYKLYTCTNPSPELCNSQSLDKWELKIYSAYKRELEFNEQGLLSGYTEYVMDEDGNYQPASRVEWSDFIDPKAPGGVEAIATDAAVTTQYYNLQGQRIANPQPGTTYIVIETDSRGLRSSRKIAY